MVADIGTKRLEYNRHKCKITKRTNYPKNEVLLETNVHTKHNGNRTGWTSTLKFIDHVNVSLI